MLCIQDTTELDYTTKKDVAGLGPLSYETRRGMYLHPTLALTPERVPLGLLAVHRWAREPCSPGQEKDPGRALEEKESVRRVDGFARVNELAEPLTDTRLTCPAPTAKAIDAASSRLPAVRRWNVQRFGTAANPARR